MCPCTSILITMPFWILPPMPCQVFILKSDWHRLAAVYLYGGWWLDCDVRCIDDMGEIFSSSVMQAELLRSTALHQSKGGSKGRSRDELPAQEVGVGCVFAWEGAVRDRPSAPLSWAFGCHAAHPFLLFAMRALAERVRALQPSAKPDPFAARIQTPHGWRYVDVLQTTGPGMLGQALGEWGGRTLHSLRHLYGEMDADEATWDRMSVLGEPLVVMMPYCFFRSRGCAHLKQRWNDSVIFHHEFDTSWRPSFWHNYLEPS